MREVKSYSGGDGGRCRVTVVVMIWGGGRCRVTVVVMEGGAELQGWWREVQSYSGGDGGRCRVTVVVQNKISTLLCTV